jgi:outer membrane protein insertion porin family
VALEQRYDGRRFSLNVKQGVLWRRSSSIRAGQALLIGILAIFSSLQYKAFADTVQGNIGAIIIKGNSNISTDAIRAVLRQKIGDQFSDANAEADRQAIENMGYFSAVTFQALQDPTGTVTENYSVVENPKVTQIVITGNTVFSTAKLMSLMRTHPGSILNTNTLAQDIQMIVQTYHAAGFRASISEDINIDPLTGILTIPIIEARVSSITITGNKKTKTKVITREMRTRPGVVYNENVFQKDLTRVYNLGLFDNVGQADITTPDVGKVAITIPVTERRTGQVSVSLGYSTLEKLVGIASLSETNFRGLGETASISWTVGGTYNQSSFEGSFGDPYIDKYHTGFDVDAYDRVVYRFDNAFLSNSSTTGTQNQYYERQRGGTLTFSRPVSSQSTAYLTGRLESVDANNFQVSTTDTFILQNTDLAGLGIRVANDTRDNVLNPAAGGLNSISIENVDSSSTTIDNAPTPLAPGSRDYLKLGIDIRRYFSLQGPRKTITQQKRVFAIRLLGGTSQSQIPFSEEYFLGGVDDLRGYPTSRFWGSHLLLINSEFRIPIASSVTGVLFTDVGDAWGSIYQGGGLSQDVSFTPHQSIGIGLRVNTPLGPIRVDEGFGSEGPQTDFAIGQSF